MHLIEYTDQAEAEQDAQAYDEHYDYSQLRTGYRPDEIDPNFLDCGGNILYNAPWPVKEPNKWRTDQ